MRVIQGLFSRWREAGNKVPACKERLVTSGDRKLLCREGAKQCLCAAAGIRFRSASTLFSGSHRGAMPRGCTIAELAVVGWTTINGVARSGCRTAVPQVVTMFVTCGSSSPCGPPHRGIAPPHHRTTAPPRAWIVGRRSSQVCRVADALLRRLYSFARKDSPDFNSTPTARRESTSSPLRAVARTEFERREARRGLPPCCTSCSGVSTKTLLQLQTNCR